MEKINLTKKKIIHGNFQGRYHANEINTLNRLETIRKAIETTESTNYGKLTCSFGIVNMRDFAGINESFETADNNLYIAKNSGKNQVIYASKIKLH